MNYNFVKHKGSEVSELKSFPESMVKSFHSLIKEKIPSIVNFKLATTSITFSEISGLDIELFLHNVETSDNRKDNWFIISGVLIPASAAEGNEQGIINSVEHDINNNSGILIMQMFKNCAEVI